MHYSQAGPFHRLPKRAQQKLDLVGLASHSWLYILAKRTLWLPRVADLQQVGESISLHTGKAY